MTRPRGLPPLALRLAGLAGGAFAQGGAPTAGDAGHDATFMRHAAPMDPGDAMNMPAPAGSTR